MTMSVGMFSQMYMLQVQLLGASLRDVTAITLGVLYTVTILGVIVSVSIVWLYCRSGSRIRSWNEHLLIQVKRIELIPTSGLKVIARNRWTS